METESLKNLLYDFWSAASKDEKNAAYKLLEPELRRLAFSTLRSFYKELSKEDMEDLFSEWRISMIIAPSINIIEKLRSSKEYSFRKYLTMSIINKCIDTIRHKKLEDNIEINHSEELGKREASGSMINEEVYKLAQNIYNKMTERQKIIFFDHIHKENPMEDICKKLNLGKSTIYNEIIAIMKLISEESDTYEEGEAIKEEMDNLVAKEFEHSDDQHLEK